jgi:hypothetical protein
MSEAGNQQRIRLAAANRGLILWRNNVGAVTTDDGRHIRFGLGNDSAKINKAFKSSDLIGINPVVITPDMVGQTIGQFVAIEVKRDNFVGRETDKRYVAQRKFIECVQRYGGMGMFAKSEKDIWGDQK